MRAQRRPMQSLIRSSTLRSSRNYLELPSVGRVAQRTETRRDPPLPGITPAIQYSFGEALAHHQQSLQRSRSLLVTDRATLTQNLGPAELNASDKSSDSPNFAR